MVAAFYLNIHFICVNGSHLVFTYQHHRTICKPCLHFAVEIVSSFLQNLQKRYTLNRKCVGSPTAIPPHTKILQ